jgi:hypothetical protein
MQRGLRLLAAGAAFIALIDGVVLVGRAADDDGPSSRVAGIQFERTTTAPSTTEAPATTLVAEPASTTTSSVPIIDEGGSTTTSPPTTARPGRTTTTTASSRPRQVTERSDNTSTFVSGPSGSSPISVVPADPSDPFRFIVFGNDTDQDGTAELRAEMANQTQRDVAFPGGMVLRFNLAKDGRFWKTIELRFPDVTVLPARGSLEVESPAPLDGPGRYDVVGEVLVEYR